MAKTPKTGSHAAKKKGCSKVMAGKAPVRKKPSGLRSK